MDGMRLGLLTIKAKLGRDNCMMKIIWEKKMLLSKVNFISVLKRWEILEIIEAVKRYISILKLRSTFRIRRQI